MMFGRASIKLRSARTRVSTPWHAGTAALRRHRRRMIAENRKKASGKASNVNSIYSVIALKALGERHRRLKR